MKKRKYLIVETLIVLGSFITIFLVNNIGIARAEFPERPITLYATFVGATELSGRMLAEAASKYLPKPINLIPKPGSSGLIAMNTVAKSKPDGYTLGMLTGAQSSVYHMRGAPFKILTDFTPIIQFEDYRFAIIVKADSQFKTLDQLIDYCKKNPGKVTYSVGGRGAISHLCMAKVLHKTGATANVVPCKGGSDAIAKVLGGHVTSSSIGFWESYVKQGQIRALTVFLPERSKDFPDIPTSKELGYGVSPPTYVGIAGPAGIPKMIAKKLEDAFTKAVFDPQFRKNMQKLYFEINYKNSADFKKHVEESYYDLEKLVNELGLVVK